MEKTYQPQAIEQHWYQIWEQQGYFSPNDNTHPYCIMIPPPNVTGSLHMGHAFQDTIMDALIRYHRMQGHSTLWQAGTDHAGIATQMVVERQLLAQGQSRHDLDREDFIKKIWEWKQQSGGTITKQLRRMGASLDWSRERFTMDQGLSKAVTEVFVQLYKQGLIYRGKRLVNWDPVLHTAISDIEVLATEEQGHLWHMRYPLADDTGHLVVATTRPETMLGDTAVAVHPEDSRYQHLIGKQIKLPLSNRVIPIIADDYVDKEFGTGCVKITPAHDFNDYEIGQRHQLEMINIFTIDAKLNDKVPTAYQNMDRYDARKQIIKDLQAQNLLEKIEDHPLKVPRGDRSHAVLEPLLTDQWFVKIEDLAKPAIKAVETGEIRFIPENWSKTYYEWMHNIQDWCISRQLWWGHRIPAWYDDQGNIYVGHNEAEIRAKYSLSNDCILTQDEDVLDTWFSSALWPFSTLGWPEKTPELEKFYPTSVLVTGFDIIFFWVARMIMMGIKFMGQVPFKEVYMHGLIRDAHGQKMSKSKGNVLDPLDVMDSIELEALVAKRTTGLMQPQMAPSIEKHTREDYPKGIPAFGADALRFTFASLASTGRDINFDIKRVEGYRNFCNKLWNASRYIIINIDPKKLTNEPIQTQTLADRWIISKLNLLIQEVTTAIGQYRFDWVAQHIYEFTWNEYCDWYIELSKANPQAKQSTLIQVLETLLRLAHPIIPFITEEIWQKIAPLAGIKAPTIMLQPYPQADLSLVDNTTIEEIEWLKQFILGIRQIRGEMNISPKQSLTVYLQNASTKDQTYIENNQVYLTKLAKIDTIKWLRAEQTLSQSASAFVGELKLLIPLAGLIDIDLEKQRLAKAINKAEKEQQRSQNKLNNPKFINNAPKEIVDKEQTIFEELNKRLVLLRQQYQQLDQ